MAVDPNNNNNHPYFCNLLAQGFIDKIQMPTAFVKEHKKMLAKTAVLKTDEGLSWVAKIVKETSKYFICEGEWPLFVAYNKLELGDMLIFYLVGKSTFQVLPYSKKPRTNIQHFEELSSSEEEEEDNIEIGPSRKCKKVKAEPEELLGHGTRSTESDDDSIDGIPRSNRGKMEFSDMVMHSVENLDTMETEKLLEGVASPSFTREGQTSGSERCKMHSHQSSISFDVHKAVIDQKKAIAYQRAKANFKSKNPFFIALMHPSNISRSYLCIKLTFARKCIPKNYRKIVLRVAGGGSWPATYHLGTERAKITTGWTAFVDDNELRLGDVCVFEVIKGTRVFMDVTIFRAAGSTPMQETDGPDCN